MTSIHQELQGREMHVLQALGINPQGSGHMHCPFPDHPDRHPSWRWDGDKARWFCSCGSGSVVDAAQRLRGGTDAEAIRLVRELLNGQAAPAVRARVVTAREIQAARLRRAQGAAALAAKLWKGASPADAGHPYLQANGVSTHNLRQSGGALLVPLIDMAGALWNLQTIVADGRKVFLSGSRVTGCFSPIGFSGPPERLVICEGWATGATLCEATGWPVLAAMSAGNLRPVAEAARQAWPAADIVLAADNDRHTKGNPGVTKATEAAQAIGGRLAVPSFPEAAEGTDFNDFFRCCSKRGVTGVTGVTKGVSSKDLKELDTHDVTGAKSVATVVTLAERDLG